MSQIRPSPSNNLGELGIFLDFYVHGNERSGHRSHTSHHYSYNYDILYTVQSRLPQEAIPRVVR